MAYLHINIFQDSPNSGGYWRELTLCEKVRFSIVAPIATPHDILKIIIVLIWVFSV